MPASFVNARYAVWSATQINVATNALDLSGGTDLGQVAPGTELPEPTVGTTEGFGYNPDVEASSALKVVVFGTTAESALTTAATANPPTHGYLYIVNASKTRADEYYCHPQAPYSMPVTNDAARASVVYGFYAQGDTVGTFHRALEATSGVTLP